jgi:hypothetical protein
VSLVSDASRPTNVEHVIMTLGIRRATVLRRLLDQAAPDILGVLGRENDEGSHSDIVRWLLDPREASELAPITLCSLVSHFREREKWRKAIRDAVALGSLTVRRDVAIAGETAGDETDLSIDLVVSGPDFVIGIENEISVTEREPSESSARWLAALPVSLRAGIFLTPSGTASRSSAFQSLSYLELVACLLEAPSAATISLREERVLAGYLQTLERRILRVEFGALREMERSP